MQSKTMPTLQTTQLIQWEILFDRLWLPLWVDQVCAIPADTALSWWCDWIGTGGWGNAVNQVRAKFTQILGDPACKTTSLLQSLGFSGK